jgi:mono/diheme cytochrome c family protein
MKRWIIWSVAGVAAFVVVAAAAVVVGTQLADKKSNRRLSVKVRPITVPSDDASIAHGRYLYVSRGCADCHGTNGGGREFINDGKGMRIVGANITTGPGGVVASFKTEDWVRAIRHGVKPDGRPILVMPSEDFSRLTDVDVGALVAYVRTFAPATGQGIVQLPLLVRVLYGYGAIKDAAAKIDHTLSPPKPVAEAVSVEHGAYVANARVGCHGPGLSGGKIPGGPPDWPPAANLTPGPGSAMARYPDSAQFIAMLRTGKRPDGTAIKVMPFKALREMSDVDAQALHMYLKTLPARPPGQR